MSERSLSLKFNVPIFKSELLTANWNKVSFYNENYKLYDGSYEGLGPCSILILYNIERHTEALYKISLQINALANLHLTYVSKLFGIIVDKEKFCLIFEKVNSNLQQRIDNKTISDKDRYFVMQDVMELILQLHENKLKAYDLRPSNIYLNENNDVRILYPLENLNLFKDDVEEEDDMIEQLLNPDDNKLRYTPPELILEQPVIDICNDIWQLGCLFIEAFSKYKIWDGYSEHEIIKQLKNLSAPKVPNDIPQLCWGLICECLNPFYKARHNIKEVLTRYYYMMGKVGLNELQIRLTSNYKIFTLDYHYLNNYLPNTNNNANNTTISGLNVSSNNLANQDDPFAVRKCHVHTKYMSKNF